MPGGHNLALMLIALCALTGLLLVFAGYLIIVELIRFRGDRKPEAPLSPEDAARDRWTVMVTDLIVGLLLVSALSTLQANATFASASGLTGQAQKDAAEFQVADAQTSSLIEYSDRLTGLIQQHSLAAKELNTEGDAAQSNGDDRLANRLYAEARVESAEVRVLTYGFLGAAPSESQQLTYTFDRSTAAQILEEINANLRTLGPGPQQSGPTQRERLETQAADSRAQAGKLLLAAAFIVGAVFFWTITRLAWKQRRLATAIPAWLAVAGGFILLLVAALS